MIQDMGDSAGEMLEALPAQKIFALMLTLLPRDGLSMRPASPRMGADPRKIRPQSVPANSRHQESLCHGRFRVYFQSLPESHPQPSWPSGVRSCDYLMSELKARRQSE